MEKKQAKERIAKLKAEINHHRYLYHVLDKLEISDAALDSLKHKLLKLEQQFPEFITPDSPTQRVGGSPSPFFKKVNHRSPMLSLEDVFGEDEFEAWNQRISKLVPDEKLVFFGGWLLYCRLSYISELFWSCLWRWRHRLFKNQEMR